MIFWCQAQEYHEGNMKYYTTDHYLNMVAESPQSKGFKVFGEMPVNTSKGLPNIHIPIYTLEVDGVRIPIELKYDASGVKVEDVASVVGLKWHLNAGGLVSRNIHDKPDKFGTKKWINGKTLSPFDDYLQVLEPTNSWFKTNYKLARTHVEAMDLHPDDFHYNLLDYSNSFKFLPSGNIIKGQSDLLDIYGVEQGMGICFTAEDIKGNYFFFGSASNALELSTRKNQLLDYTYRTIDIEYAKHYTSATTGWYLDEILTKNNETIQFIYDTSYHYEEIKSPASQKMELLPGCGSTKNIDCVEDKPLGGSYPYETGTRLISNSTTPLIKEIRTEAVTILFNYEDSSVLSNGKNISGWSKRLVEIVVEDKILNKKKKFGFKYDTFLGDARLKLTEVYEKSPALFQPGQLPSYRMVYDESSALPSINSLSKDMYGYYNDNGATWLYPLTSATLLATNDAIVRSRLFDRSHNQTVLGVGTLKELHYPTGGYTAFEFEPNVMGHDQQEPMANYLGGLRIKSIKDMDGEGGVYHHRKYTYQEHYKSASFIYLRKVNGIQTLSSELMSVGDGIDLKTGFTYTEVEEELYDASTYLGKNSYSYEPRYSFNAVIGGDLIKKRVFNASNKLIQFDEWDLNIEVEKFFSYKQPSMFDVILHPLNREIQVYTTNYMRSDIQEIKTQAVKTSKTEINYSGTTAMPITTVEESEYNSEMMLSKTKTNVGYTAVLNNNKVQSYTYNAALAYGDSYTTYEYAIDYPTISSPSSPSTLAKGLLINNKTYKDNVQVSGNYYTYDASGNLTQIYAYNKGKGSKPSNAPDYIPTNYEHQASISYENGRPVVIQRNEYQASPQSIVSYLWGYKHRFIVAKLHGLSYYALSETDIQRVKNASLQGSQDLNSAFNLLKEKYPKYQITTYEYHPLFGVERITQPNNLYEKYEYDIYERLKYIRDQEDYILQEYFYNYK